MPLGSKEIELRSQSFEECESGINAELGGIHLYGWVGASYLLASTVTVPLYGKLADRRGRKPILLLGIALFLAGSLASGLAATIEQLIVFRALQGLGAGAVQPIVLTIIAFWRIKPLAGALLLPYLAWVSYAAALNLAVWRLNPELLG